MLSPRVFGKDRWLEYFALGCGGGVCTRASTITPWSSLLTADCGIPRSEFAETRQQQKPQARQSSKEATRVEAMAKEIGRKGKVERVALEQTKDPIMGHRSFKVFARRSETDSVVPRAAWRTSELTEGRPEAGQLAQLCVQRVTKSNPALAFRNSARDGQQSRLHRRSSENTCSCESGGGRPSSAAAAAAALLASSFNKRSSSRTPRPLLDIDTVPARPRRTGTVARSRWESSLGRECPLQGRIGAHAFSAHVGRCKKRVALTSTPLSQAVHPCKIARGRVKISFGGAERDHEVRGCSVAAHVGPRRDKKDRPR